MVGRAQSARTGLFAREKAAFRTRAPIGGPQQRTVLRLVDYIRSQNSLLMTRKGSTTSRQVLRTSCHAMPAVAVVATPSPASQGMKV